MLTINHEPDKSVGDENPFPDRVLALTSGKTFCVRRMRARGPVFGHSLNLTAKVLPLMSLLAHRKLLVCRICAVTGIRDTY